MKVKEIIAELSRRYLKCMERGYEEDPEKALNCIGFHLYQAAVQASVLNSNFSIAIEEIIERFNAPYNCPERFADTNSCEYARLLDSYSLNVIKEIEKILKNGNQ